MFAPQKSGANKKLLSICAEQVKNKKLHKIIEILKIIIYLPLTTFVINEAFQVKFKLFPEGGVQ